MSGAKQTRKNQNTKITDDIICNSCIFMYANLFIWILFQS